MDILKIALSMALSLGFLFLLWSIKGWLLRPTVGGKDASLTVTVSARGAAKNLEHTIYGLNWLRKSGSLYADILIVDEGLEPKAAELARLLSEDDMSIQVCSPDQIEYFIIRSCYDG
ncbi:MAG: hypothetical protein GX025_04635 [Clostridiales bacterium]|jgi:hypothetical protein|nr:hypothetical protein [Clostridiales bacterium]